MSYLPIFQDNFIFGVATSAHQIEGDIERGKCIWDIGNTHLAKEACSHYTNYREDIAIMKSLSIKHYRLSISWSRLIVHRRLNVKAVNYYNNLIDELTDNGITPYVTLYHWDYPLGLYEEYGGWITSKSIDDYVEYASLCFDLFADRVKYWITFNEPWCVAILGYCIGNHAPYHSNAPGVEPYLVAHNILLAHARVVEIFRKSYRGYISMALNTPWWESLTESIEDKRACERAMCFSLDWFLDPIINGDYPELLKQRVGSRLPTFTDREKESLKGSVDFLSINHYFTLFGGKNSICRTLSNIRNISSKLLWDTITKEHYFKDMNVVIGEVDMPKTDMGWYIYPRGIGEVLSYCKSKCDYPIYVTENGMSMEGTEDHKRIDYITNYLIEIRRAVDKGVNVRGYFLWSLMDNFEWDHDYTKCFGITTRDRVLKKSAYWYSDICKQYK